VPGKTRLTRRFDHGLRHDLDGAELAEMVVESEGGRDLELLDHDLGRAVGEAPVLVGVTDEELPGITDLILGQEMKRCESAQEEVISGTEGATALPAGP
jgi:hypothetical protein